MTSEPEGGQTRTNATDTSRSLIDRDDAPKLDMDEVLKFLEKEIQSFEKLFDELNGETLFSSHPSNQIQSLHSR